jgi:monoamine oxidase
MKGGRVTVARYDDGRADVPRRIAEPVERVIVVGAGIAGLTVANALTQAGIECVVLEARSRIGGRLHTVDLGGSLVDLGGSWIHHPVGNPLRRFADQVGVECRPSNPLRALGGFDFGSGRRLTAAEVEASVACSSRHFRARSVRYAVAWDRTHPQRTLSMHSWPRPGWNRTMPGDPAGAAGDS